MALKWHARCPAVAKMLREGLEDCLTVSDFPQHHRRRLRSTNLLESLMKRLKARTKVVGVFPNRASCDRLAGAILIEVDEEWSLETAPYFGMEHAGGDAVRAIT
jgi:transposase-like protein